MLYLGINYGNLPVIEHFQKKHRLEQLIVVADAGLLSNKTSKSTFIKTVNIFLEQGLRTKVNAGITLLNYLCLVHDKKYILLKINKISNKK